MARPPVPPRRAPMPMKRPPSAARRAVVLRVLRIIVGYLGGPTGLGAHLFWTTSGRGTPFPSVVVAGVHVEAGDPLGPEHRDVAAVVLDGEAQLEPVAAPGAGRGLLETAGAGGVAPGGH